MSVFGFDCNIDFPAAAPQKVDREPLIFGEDYIFDGDYGFRRFKELCGFDFV